MPGVFPQTLASQSFAVFYCAIGSGRPVPGGRLISRLADDLAGGQALSARRPAFPHVSQAYLIERHVTALDGTPLPGIAALGVTSLDAIRWASRHTERPFTILGLRS